MLSYNVKIVFFIPLFKHVLLSKKSIKIREKRKNLYFYCFLNNLPKNKGELIMIAQNWLLVSLIAPICWALVNVVDLWMSKEAFNDEEGATAIIGLFAILPWGSVLFFGMPEIDGFNISLGVIAGMLFSVFTYFYFRSIYRSNDVTLVSILMNLAGLIVPLMAAIFVKERLGLVSYIGIAFVLIGSFIACFNGKIMHENLKSIAMPMTIAIFSFSLSMIIDQEVYKNASFYGGFLYFSLGMFLVGAFCYFRKSITEARLVRIKPEQIIGVVIAETTNIVAILGSHYAISISPSVSFIAVIETTVPLFILAFSLLIYGACLKRGIQSDFTEALQEQFVGLQNKIPAVILTGIGLYLFS